ncbi:MAG: hypothetical protein QXI58_00375 [Candidatus Micrarchaeia archaeon]
MKNKHLLWYKDYLDLISSQSLQIIKEYINQNKVFAKFFGFWNIQDAKFISEDEQAEKYSIIEILFKLYKGQVLLDNLYCYFKELHDLNLYFAHVKLKNSLFIDELLRKLNNYYYIRFLDDSLLILFNNLPQKLIIRPTSNPIIDEINFETLKLSLLMKDYYSFNLKAAKGINYLAFYELIGGLHKHASIRKDKIA